LTARRLISAASRDPAAGWAGRLARAIQVSLVGFAVGGAFVNIGYWEPPYYEILILLVASNLVIGRRESVTADGPPRANDDRPGRLAGSPTQARSDSA
jgi:hypothetical protein